MSEIEQERSVQDKNSNDSSKHNALFGKYEIRKLVGCGSFAKVYHARNTRTCQSMAIKVIDKRKIQSPDLMSNIKREISIMKRLNHPHIVKLHEVLATKTKTYFVLEFARGGELFEKILKRRFSEDLSRKYFRQLISVIGYCHYHGVYHRDLKPENILLDENDDLKVTDFGLSASTEQIKPDGALHTVCGSPAYVAPEILMRKGYNGAKVDVWSCGIILFALTAGYLPFYDSNLMAMYKKIYRGEYRCPRWMPNDLRRFLARLLDTNPQTRITVDEILDDPWFAKGGYDRRNFFKFHDEYQSESSCSNNNDDDNITSLNAFDVIAFSSGLDLSGLFDESNNRAQDRERFVSAESPDKLVERIEEFGKTGSSLRVRRKKEWGFEIEGYNCNLVMAVEVYRLTEELVVVEALTRRGDNTKYEEVWQSKLRPLLVATKYNE